MRYGERGYALLLAIAVIAANVPLYHMVQQDYIPTDVDEGEFEVRISAPEGTSITAMEEMIEARVPQDTEGSGGGQGPRHGPGSSTAGEREADGTEGVIPAAEQVPDEVYEHGDRLKCYVVGVTRGARGPQISLSPTPPKLVRTLFATDGPGGAIRYRCRGGRPEGGAVSHEVSTRPRSARRMRIG